MIGGAEPHVIAAGSSAWYDAALSRASRLLELVELGDTVSKELSETADADLKIAFEVACDYMTQRLDAAHKDVLIRFLRLLPALGEQAYGTMSPQSAARTTCGEMAGQLERLVRAGVNEASPCKGWESAVLATPEHVSRNSKNTYLTPSPNSTHALPMDSIGSSVPSPIICDAAQAESQIRKDAFEELKTKLSDVMEDNSRAWAEIDALNTLIENQRTQLRRGATKPEVRNVATSCYIKPSVKTKGVSCLGTRLLVEDADVEACHGSNQETIEEIVSLDSADEKSFESRVSTTVSSFSVNSPPLRDMHSWQAERHSARLPHSAKTSSSVSTECVVNNARGHARSSSDKSDHHKSLDGWKNGPQSPYQSLEEIFAQRKALMRKEAQEAARKRRDGSPPSNSSLVMSGTQCAIVSPRAASAKRNVSPSSRAAAPQRRDSPRKDSGSIRPSGVPSSTGSIQRNAFHPPCSRTPQRRPSPPSRGRSAEPAADRRPRRNSGSASASSRDPHHISAGSSKTKKGPIILDSKVNERSRHQREGSTSWSRASRFPEAVPR